MAQALLKMGLVEDATPHKRYGEGAGKRLLLVLRKPQPLADVARTVFTVVGEP